MIKLTGIAVVAGAVAATAGLAGTAAGQLEGPKVKERATAERDATDGQTQRRRGAPERLGGIEGDGARAERQPQLSAFRGKFDLDEDGTLSAEERETLDVVLPAYQKTLAAPHDADGDGLLSRSEWQAAVKTLGLELPERPETGRQRGGEGAAGKDGVPGEGREARQRGGRGGGEGPQAGRGGQRDRVGGGGDPEQRRAEMLKRFDTDGDGELSQEERTAARATVESQRYTAMLERLDANGDGVINAAEVKDANAKIAERATVAKERAKERAAERPERAERDGERGERRGRPGRGPGGGEGAGFQRDV